MAHRSGSAFSHVAVHDGADSPAGFSAQNLPDFSQLMLDAECASSPSSGDAQQQLPINLALHGWLTVHALLEGV